MDIEAARHSRPERLFYALRAAWHKRGALNRPTVRYYLLLFVGVSVLLAIRNLVESSNVVDAGLLLPSVPESPIGILTNDWNQLYESVAARVVSSRDTCPEKEQQQQTPIDLVPPHGPTDDPEEVHQASPELTFEVRPHAQVLADPALVSLLRTTTSAPLKLVVATGLRQRTGERAGVLRTLQRLHTDRALHGELCLAAVHVGVAVRIMVLAERDLLNPVVTQTSAETELQLEASAFEPEVLVPRNRPAWTTVQYWQVDGDTYTSVEETLHGMDARCVLHLLEVMDAAP